MRTFGLTRPILAIAVAASLSVGASAASAFNGGCTDQTCRQWNDYGPSQDMYANYWSNLVSALQGMFR